jgi:hypothetical protein
VIPHALKAWLLALTPCAALAQAPAAAPASDPSAPDDEVFIVQGDTQTWSYFPDGPENWWATNRAICAMRPKPKLVIGTGDIVEFHLAGGQWESAKRAFDILRDCGVPFSPAAGNHDWAWPTSTPGWKPFDEWIPNYAEGRTFSPDKRAWWQPMGRSHVLGVLNDGSSAAQAEWLANQLRDETHIVLMQHGAIEPDAAWRIYPGLSINRALELLGDRVVGVIGGHWLSGDYVQFKPLAPGVFGLFSNWQSRTNASGSGWYGWVTVLTLTRTQWCVETLNVLTRARDRFEDRSCLKR